MIPRSNPDLDPTDQDVSVDPRLITDFQRAYRRSPPLDAVDDAIRHAVDARMAQQEAPERRGRRHRLLPRLSVPLAAVVLLALGLGTYLHGQGSAPVSAQTVLHRAATAGPGPNLATHATYRISSSDGSSGSADLWTGYDGSGQPAQFGLTWTGVDPAQMPRPSVKGLPFGTQLAQQLSVQPNAYTVQQTTLDGVSVYALRSDITGEATYYFNTHSYVLDGIDWMQGSPSWHVRLGSYTTMPLSAVPPGTFDEDSGSGQKP